MTTQLLEQIDKEIAFHRMSLDKLEKARALLSGTVQAPVGANRLEQLLNYLAGGPKTRKQILMDIGLPDGTLSYLLAKNRKMFNNKNGQWSLKEQP